MSQATGTAMPLTTERPVLYSRLVHLASIVVCGVLPAVVLATLFVETVLDEAVAFDFRVYYAAADAILAGDSPYPDLGDPQTLVGRSFVYPPLTALGAIPLTVLPVEIAGLLVMAGLVALTLATLYVLGVRDWRCYGAVLLWPAVLSAVQTGSVTILLAFAAALTWRLRDSTWGSASALAVSLAIKTILWPLAVWLAATRRVAAGVLAVGGALLVVAVSWAVIGFAGISTYPDLVRRLETAVGDDSYTAYIVALDAGVPAGAARALWLGIGVALLFAVVLLGRRGHDRAAFVVCIAAALALTPIVWLHYFALLAVVVALAQPRLGVAWFVPLAMVLTPGSGHPTPFETAWTLAIAVLTVAVSLHALRGRSEARGRSSVAVALTRGSSR